MMQWTIFVAMKKKQNEWEKRVTNHGEKRNEVTQHDSDIAVVLVVC